jgi:predicted site-specific integrase-resolvase
MTAKHLPPEDRLLSRKQIAEMYGVTPHTAYVWDRQGVLKGIRVGKRAVRYRMSEVRAALEGRR